MNKSEVSKIRVLNLLRRHGFLSAKVIANKTKMRLDDVAQTISEMVADGSVMAEDTGRDWGGEPVILFRLSDATGKRQSSAWSDLAASIRGNS